MILFLDTPRADNGLNHRYFVASRDSVSEAEIRRSAQLARESNAGVGYLAVSRFVQQVSRGQIRDGLELLVLAGIPSPDPVLRSRLHERLREMLASIPDDPIPVSASSPGMLIQSQMIADMEIQLSKLLPSERKKSNIPTIQPERNTMNKSRFVPIIVIVILIIAAWFMIRQLQHRHEDTGNPAENSKDTGTSEEKFNTKEDWQFLKRDDWKKLAQLTGLPKNWTSSDANLWAESLMREADPDFIGNVTAQDLEENSNINIMVEAANEATYPDGKPNTDAVFKSWIAKRNDGKGLLKLADALGDSDSSMVATSELRDILAAWEQALRKLANNDPEAKQIIQKSTSDVFSETAMFSGEPRSKIKMITESDLRRYNAINDFLNSPCFIKKISIDASEENFGSLDWLGKVERLGKIGNMRSVDTPIAVFCEELHKAATKTSQR